MVIERNFAGKLDMDNHPSRVKPSDYVDAVNITFKDRTRKNVAFPIVGHTLVPFALPSGTNITIGRKEDPIRNRIIYFVYNSNGNHFIAKFDNATGTISKIIESKTNSGGVDIFRFQATTRIWDIDIFHRDIAGDLLFFNTEESAPFGFNIDTISTYFANGVPEYVVRAAKRPPLDVLTAEYGSDSNIKVNGLRGKLFQFRLRYIYKDGYRSTWSGWSKTPLPKGGYTGIIDADPTKNNHIVVRGTGGGVDCAAVELAMRESNGTTWGIDFLVDRLDMTDYGIAVDGAFVFKFYNDGAYTAIDTEDSGLLQSHFPLLAKAQTSIDGKYLAYGGVTEGYDRLRRSQVNVQVSARYADTSANEETSGPPSLTWSTSSTPSGSSPTNHKLFLYVGPDVSGGCRYHVEFSTVSISGQVTNVNVEYTANNSDTRTNVRDQLIALLIAAGLQGAWSVQATDGSNGFTIKIERNVFPSVGGGIYTALNIYAVQPTSTQGSTQVWDWGAKHHLGIIYYDEYGRTNGVISYTSTEDDVNDFSVTIPGFAIHPTTFAPRVGIVTASINHAPPSWAKYMQWVRTSDQVTQKYLYYVTCLVEQDNNFFYFCIANLDKFRVSNTGFVPSYEFLKGDRIKVIDIVNTSAEPRYSESYLNDDYEIIGVVTRPMPGAGVDVTGRFLKVKRPDAVKTYLNYNLIKLYTPAKRSLEDEQVFFEFGECYPIFTDVNGNRLHSGNLTNQSVSPNQPATFEFRDGDAYLKFRKIYPETLSETIGVLSLSMIDANYSDYWQSAVSANGRPVVIDSSIRSEFKRARLRFSQSFEEGVSVNGLTTFYPLNYDDYKLKYGTIRKLIDRNNSLVVMQELKIGIVPIFQVVMKYVDGEDTVVSDRLLNRIQYLQEDFGVSSYKGSIVTSGSHVYGWDNIRKLMWRLSQSGLDPISKQNNINSFAIAQCISRNVHSVFDTEKEQCITFFDQAGSVPSNSIVWDEDINGFVSRLLFNPEMSACINGLLVFWKNGVMYAQNASGSSDLNKFIGAGKVRSSLSVVFNDSPVTKKVFNTITTVSGEIWRVESTESNVYSYKDVVQRSNVPSANFAYTEGQFNAAFRKDENSDGGKINGASMKGQWIKAVLTNDLPTTNGWLLSAIIEDISSPKNNK